MDKKVLIVEDDNLSVFVYRKCIEMKEVKEHFINRRRMSIDFIDCAKDALALPHILQYDLIITDYYLPRMMGSDFIKALNKMGYQHKIYILTGCSPDECADLLCLPHVEGVATKGTRFNIIEAILKECFGALQAA